MEKEYACYCGLYCENCAINAKVYPAAKKLYEEMKNAGFDDIVNFIPGGNGFWKFLEEITENRICTSCRDGSGNPGCMVRKCAKEKSVEMCAFCEEYPCPLINNFDGGYPMLKSDNDVLLSGGWDEWGKMQDERRASNFTYSNK